jgi:Flp pilus assembly protein TadG
VEFALVGSLTFLLIIGLMVVGMGIFRYNEVASLARQGSRWASVRGTQYQKDTGNPAASAGDIINFVTGQAAGLDTSQLTIQPTWNTSNSPYRTQIVNNQLVSVNNTVSVAVSYQWTPEVSWIGTLMGGSINFTSTSVTPMTY